MSNAPEQVAASLEGPLGAHFPIQGVCELGRSSTNQVCLNDERISRRHAAIQAQPNGEFWLIDFGSANGTHLNHARLSRPTRLQDGDRLQIGPFQFTFRLSRSGSADPSAETRSAGTILEIVLQKRWLLVADLVESTTLMADVSPEEFPRVTGRWLAECRKIIEKSGGRINQFMGDGYFASWQDQEGLASNMSQAVQGLKQLQSQSRPQCRYILHWGEVTLGGTAVGEEERISGREVHFAFRLEKLASRLGQARLLSAPAQARLSQYLATVETGPYTMPGFPEPFTCHAF